MLIATKNNVVFIVLTLTGAVLASESNSSPVLEPITALQGNQGVPHSADEVGVLLLAALHGAEQQLSQDPGTNSQSLQEPSSPPLLAARRPRSAPLLHTPEFLLRSSLAAAVAAQDVAAIQAALARGERPTAAMLQQRELSEEIMLLLQSYMQGQ